MKAVKKYWKTPVLSFGVLILCTSSIFLVRSYYNFHVNIVIGLFAYMLLTFWLRRKAPVPREKTIHTFLLLTPFIALSIAVLFLPIIHYAPGLIFAPFLGILLGYLLEKATSRILRVAIAIVPLFIGLWVYVQFANTWQDFMIYGTLRNGETFKECSPFTFSKDSVALTNDDFIGKTTVFFIWNTSCVYTPRYIPALKEKYKAYSDKENIAFYLVNIPIDRDTIGADSAYLANYDIEIDNLTGPDNEELYHLFGPFGFPLTVVLNPEGNIVFLGSVDKIDRTLQRSAIR